MRLDDLLSTVSLVKSRQTGIAFRVNTNGLPDASVVAKLLQSDLVALGGDDARRETRIQSISVSLPCDNPTQFDQIAYPSDYLIPQGKGFSDVCSFICMLAEAGVSVECTAVEREGVNITATRALAMSLGATSFRVRSYHP